MSPNDLITLLVGLMTLFWAFPFFRLLSSWLEDRTLDGRLAFLGFVAHVVLLTSLWRYGNMILLLIYLSFVMLA